MNNPITVLIVDDNVYMRETLNFLISHTPQLKLLGEACNGHEALAQAQVLAPDIILMDINMSPINGFEATRKLLKINPRYKIIGISVHTQFSYARNLLSLGAKGYLTKTSSHHEIVEAIVRVANGEEYICNELRGIQ
ncbi:MAG TPA: response regulator transcription factor [Flavitalea sp.]|nr:response regulator transcription factor [Flavitalea sp.]